MNDYKSALRLMITASDDDLDKELQNIKEVDEETPAEKKPQSKSKRVQQLQEALENKPPKLSKEEKEQQAAQRAIDKLQRDKEEAARKEPSTKDVVRMTEEAVGGVIEPAEYSDLEGGVPTTRPPKSELEELTPTGAQAKTYGDWKSKAHKALDKVVRKEEKVYANQLRKLREQGYQEEAEEISDEIDESTANAINEWRQEHGYPAEHLPEKKFEGAEDEEEGIYTQNYEATSEIINYIRFYGKIKGSQVEEKELLDPLSFYSLLKSIDKDKAFQFAKYIYQLVEVQADIAAKMSNAESKKINRNSVQNQFVKWLLTELKEVLTFIAPTINGYLDSHPLEKIERLEDKKISSLVSTCGGYLNQLINRALVKQERFIDIVEGSLKKEIEFSAKRSLWNRKVKAMTPIQRVSKAVEAMVLPQDTFPPGSIEADVIIGIYEDALHANIGLSTGYGGAEQPNIKGVMEPTRSPEYSKETGMFQETEEELS